MKLLGFFHIPLFLKMFSWSLPLKSGSRSSIISIIFYFVVLVLISVFVSNFVIPTNTVVIVFIIVNVVVVIAGVSTIDVVFLLINKWCYGGRQINSGLIACKGPCSLRCWSSAINSSVSGEGLYVRQREQVDLWSSGILSKRHAKAVIATSLGPRQNSPKSIHVTTVS